MSLSYQKLEPILVQDPRCILKNKRDFAVIKGGTEVNYKVYTSTSISTSSIQFSAPPPSGNVIVDRKVFLTLPIRLTFTGIAIGPTGPPTPTLLKQGYDAPRQLPFSSACDTLRISINGLAMTIDMSDVIHALQHFNTDMKLKSRDYSQTAIMPDQSQNYFDLESDIRNPLATYGSSLDETVEPRGGFSFKVVSNTDTSAVVDMVVREPFFLSPLYWGHGNSSGFINVTQFDVNVTMLQNAGYRMWSHMFDAANNNSVISNIQAQYSNFTTPFSFPTAQPLLEFTYISQNGNDLFSPNEPSTYPYFNINRYPTDYGTAIAYDNTFKTISINSNNLQLSSIPRRIYLYVRTSNADLLSSPNYTDTYYGIKAINMQWNNRSGLFSGASQNQLYEMSVKNHIDMSWQEWSGYPVYKTGTNFSNATGVTGGTIGTVGSIICIEMATDVGLAEWEAPGQNGQYQLQIRADVYNCDPTLSHNLLKPTMYIVTIEEGTFTIPGIGAATNNIGVISKEDVLSAKRNQFINYEDTQEINGGNFMSGLKKFGHNVGKFVHDAAPYVKAAIPYVREGISLAKDLAPLLAAGEVVGEGRMNRCDLKHRIRRI